MRDADVYGITRIRHEHPVAGIEEGKGDIEHALFRAYERQHLPVGVDAIHAIVARIPAGHSLAERRKPYRHLVAVAVRALQAVASPFTAAAGGGRSGASYTKRHYVASSALRRAISFNLRENQYLRSLFQAALPVLRVLLFP